MTFVLVGLFALLGFISAFVPWALRDFGSITAWFYPFKCYAESKTSPVHYTRCEEEDLGGWTASSITAFYVPFAGNKKCQGFLIATIVFTFIHVIFAVLGLVAMLLLIFKRWTKGKMPYYRQNALISAFGADPKSPTQWPTRRGGEGRGGGLETHPARNSDIPPRREGHMDPPLSSCLHTAFIA